MSVELDPPELGFKRPFTQEVSQVLTLRNPSNDPIAFKVKTTAPKQYCVRPNSGRIEPGGDVEVQVLLQAMKEDPPADAKCRDKFLVQSVAVRNDGDANIAQIWSNIEANSKSSIQEKKIRVNWLSPEHSGVGTSAGLAAAGVGGVAAAGGAATVAAATNGVPASHNDEPPAYSSPSQAAVTPQRSMAEKDIKSEPSTAQSSSTLAAAGAAIPTSQDELQQQLQVARAKIAELQASMAEGLRQRKPQEAAEKATNSVSQSMQNAPAPGGVPIQYVAGLCLLCFLIAWLFF